MVAPSAPADPPTLPEPSTGMDDQKISPVEELAQGFKVTLEIVDKPPDELLERPKTPRAFADRNRECYYVTTGPQKTNETGPRPLNMTYQWMPIMTPRPHLLPRR